MKKTLFSWLITISLFSLILTGCTNAPADLYRFAGSDDFITISGNTKTVLENCGCKFTDKGIKLSDCLDDVLSKAFRHSTVDLDDILMAEGIDYEHALFTIDTEANGALCIGLTDQDDFIKYLKKNFEDDLDIEEKDEYTFIDISERHVGFFVADNVACMLFSDKNTIDSGSLKEYLRKKDRKPLEEWQKQALNDGNCLNGYMNVKDLVSLIKKEGHVDFNEFLRFCPIKNIDKIWNTYLKFHSSLEGTTAKVSYRLVDKDGKDFMLDYTAKNVDTQLLKYATATDLGVMLFGMPSDINWSNMFKQIKNSNRYMSPSDEEAFNKMEEILKSIDGTVMLAGGPIDLSYRINRPENWHIVIAAQLKPGDADKYVSMIYELLTEVQAHEYDAALSYNEGVINFSNNGMKISVTADGNNFVGVMGEATDNGPCSIKASDFQDAIVGAVVNVTKENILSAFVKMPFGVNLKMILNKDQSYEVTYEETDTEGLFLENIIEFASNL